MSLIAAAEAAVALLLASSPASEGEAAQKKKWVIFFEPGAHQYMFHLRQAPLHVGRSYRRSGCRRTHCQGHPVQRTALRPGAGQVVGSGVEACVCSSAPRTAQGGLARLAVSSSRYDPDAPADSTGEAQDAAQRCREAACLQLCRFCRHAAAWPQAQGGHSFVAWLQKNALNAFNKLLLLPPLLLSCHLIAHWIRADFNFSLHEKQNLNSFLDVRMGAAGPLAVAFAYFSFQINEGIQDAFAVFGTEILLQKFV